MARQRFKPVPTAGEIVVLTLVPIVIDIPKFPKGPYSFIDFSCIYISFDTENILRNGVSVFFWIGSVFDFSSTYVELGKWKDSSSYVITNHRYQQFIDPY